MRRIEVIDRVLGVELKMVNDQLWSVSTCLVTKKGQSLQLEAVKNREGTLVEVLDKLPGEIPIALALTGKGIVHKNLHLTEQVAPERVVGMAYPSIDEKDFYVQQYREHHHVVVSIGRKAPIDELLVKLKRTGLRIYRVSFGAMAAIPILSQLNQYGNLVRFNGHVFELNAERQFLNYAYEEGMEQEFPLKIAEVPIEAIHVVAYANAFQLLLHQQLEPVQANIDEISQQFEGFLNDFKLKKRAVMFGAALFLSLLISFILFSTYNKENARLAQLIGTQVAGADQTDVLKKNMVANEGLLRQLNWNLGYNYGFILDEIGQTMPKQLQLQEVLVNDFKTAAEKLTRTPNIKLMGITTNLTAVNNWIFVLKERKWVKTIQLLQYQGDAETANYQFNLAITY